MSPPRANKTNLRAAPAPRTPLQPIPARSSIKTETTSEPSLYLPAPLDFDADENEWSSQPRDEQSSDGAGPGSNPDWSRDETGLGPALVPAPGLPSASDNSGDLRS